MVGKKLDHGRMGSEKAKFAKKKKKKKSKRKNMRLLRGPEKKKKHVLWVEERSPFVYLRPDNGVHLFFSIVGFV